MVSYILTERLTMFCLIAKANGYTNVTCFCYLFSDVLAKGLIYNVYTTRKNAAALGF